MTASRHHRVVIEFNSGKPLNRRQAVALIRDMLRDARVFQCWRYDENFGVLVRIKSVKPS